MALTSLSMRFGSGYHLRFAVSALVPSSHSGIFKIKLININFVGKNINIFLCYVQLWMFFRMKRIPGKNSTVHTCVVKYFVMRRDAFSPHVKTQLHFSVCHNFFCSILAWLHRILAWHWWLLRVGNKMKETRLDAGNLRPKCGIYCPSSNAIFLAFW